MNYWSSIFRHLVIMGFCFMEASFHFIHPMRRIKYFIMVMSFPFFQNTFPVKQAYGQVIQSKGYVQTGKASFYPGDRGGAITMNGEKYDMYSMTAAHHHLAFNSLVKVTNIKNGRQVIVRINDRPYTNSRILDVTFGAAKALDMLQQVISEVIIEVVGFAEDGQGDWQGTSAEETKVVQGSSHNFPDLISLKSGIYSQSGTRVYPKGFGVQVASFSEASKVATALGSLANPEAHQVFIQVDEGLFKLLVGSFLSKEAALPTVQFYRSIGVAAFPKKHETK